MKAGANALVIFDEQGNPPDQASIQLEESASRHRLTLNVPVNSPIHANPVSPQGSAAVASPSVDAGKKTGQLTHDLNLGAANDVHLKSGQVVNILKNSGATLVIGVQLPDGTSGIYQVDASAVTLEDK
jgi:hypothetical protein